MGCSNTKAFPNASGLESETLNNTKNVLNSIDPSKVIEEGEKILNQAQENLTEEGDKLMNQAQEIIEKSAAALESVISGKSEEAAEDTGNETDSPKLTESIPEDANGEEKAEEELKETDTKSEEVDNASEKPCIEDISGEAAATEKSEGGSEVNTEENEGESKSIVEEHAEEKTETDLNDEQDQNETKVTEEETEKENSSE